MDRTPSSVRRFDDRADDYVRARPGYPAEVVALLERNGLPRGATVADIGSGTGKLSEIFIAAGHQVIGIEPNEGMRAAAESHLGRHPRFRSMAARAESTGLAAASVDAVVVGQAFHWFEERAARREFARILRPGGLAALIWNDRRTAGCPLLADYERLLLQHCPDYGERLRQAPDASALGAFFAPGPMHEARFDNRQVLDWVGFRTRVLSASYVPRQGAVHEALFAELRSSFERHADAGWGELLYDTRVFWGPLLPA